MSAMRSRSRFPRSGTVRALAALAIGMTPAEALRAATLSPAATLGRESESGTVSEGKVADLVLLRANPFADIRNTREIEAVLLRGKVLPEGELRRLRRGAGAVTGFVPEELGLAFWPLEVEDPGPGAGD